MASTQKRPTDGYRWTLATCGTILLLIIQTGHHRAGLHCLWIACGYLCSFVLAMGFFALAKSRKISYGSLHDLFKFVLSIIDGEKALLPADVGHLWNSNINKGPEVEAQQLKDIGIVWFSSKSALLMDHVVNDRGRMIWDSKVRNWTPGLDGCWYCVTWMSVSRFCFNWKQLEGSFCCLDGTLMATLVT